MEVIFANGCVKVYDKVKNGKLIILGLNNGSLYTVDLDVTLSNNSCSYAVNENKNEGLILWHSHLSLRTLKCC